MIIAALVKDLFFRTKMEAVAAQAGKKIHFFENPAQLPEANMFLIDLEVYGTLGIEAAKRQNASARIIGYLPHADVSLRDRARASGCEVFARSDFMFKLPDILEKK